MSYDPAKLLDLFDTVQALHRHRRENRLEFFEPYDKQFKFFELGATKRERLLMAGNQLGKSEAGAFECACHLTGKYPDWWPGRKFDHPVSAWAAGVSTTTVRDVQQAKLCGKPGVLDDFGTGYIPKEDLIDKTTARGATDAYDTIQVKHKSGGTSTLSFKSYEQGREKFQAATLDFIWLDEEPDYDIYSETLTRTNATGGMVYLTFTPLKGRSEVVLRYLDEFSHDRAFVQMSIMDAKHISPEEREKIIAGYKAHERQARINGDPMLGEGRIFETPEDAIKVPWQTDWPVNWPKIWGIDFGITHAFGAVLMAWDRDNDVLYVLDVVKMTDSLPIHHAAAMKARGANFPVAWPHDGNGRDKGTGKQMHVLYKDQGLRMLPTHATFPNGSNSTEDGVTEMQQRIVNGMLRVSSHLEEWFAEYRLYHRKDGLIVKVNDDLLSATRMGMMMRRHAQAGALGGQGRMRRRTGPVAKGVDFDVFGG